MILSFGVVSEMAVGGWLVNFLEKSYKWEPTAAAGCCPPSSSASRRRLAARPDNGPDRLHAVHHHPVRVDWRMHIYCNLWRRILCVPVRGRGIGIAPIYPTVMALIAKRYPKESDTAITFIVTMMGIGSVIGNYAIGAITNGFKQMYGSGTELGSRAGFRRAMASSDCVPSYARSLASFCTVI